jgi:hypothetical protein
MGTRVYSAGLGCVEVLRPLDAGQVKSGELGPSKISFCARACGGGYEQGDADLFGGGLNAGGEVDGFTNEGESAAGMVADLSGNNAAPMDAEPYAEVDAVAAVKVGPGPFVHALENIE